MKYKMVLVWFNENHHASSKRRRPTQSSVIGFDPQKFVDQLRWG